jgi:hypothetical protein
MIPDDHEFNWNPAQYLSFNLIHMHSDHGWLTFGPATLRSRYVLHFNVGMHGRLERNSLNIRWDRRKTDREDSEWATHEKNKNSHTADRTIIR